MTTPHNKEIQKIMKEYKKSDFYQVIGEDFIPFLLSSITSLRENVREEMVQKTVGGVIM